MKALVRQTRAKPLHDKPAHLARATLAKLSSMSDTAAAIRYALSR